jgi:hypothetical protein
MTQSLLNLVQKAWKDLTPFSAVVSLPKFSVAQALVRFSQALFVFVLPLLILLSIGHA